MIFRVIEAGHLPFSKDYGGDGRRRQTWSQFDEITIIALTAPAPPSSTASAAAEGDVIDTFRVAGMTTMTAATSNKAEMICQGHE